MKKDFSLGQWKIQFSEGVISSAGESKHLEPKALSVLMTLALAEGQVVSREKLFNEVWPNQVVGEDAINSSIAALRRALGDDRKTNLYIQTVPKKGYKLVKDVLWHEIDSLKTGQPRHSRTKGQDLLNGRRYLILALLVISLLFMFFQLSEQNQAPIKNQLSIAVLPFEIYSSDNEINYFADGLAEEMLHQLVTNPNLKVMSRSASFQYRNTDKNLSVIAEELNVKYLIEGSVRVENDDLRITVQLIDAENNFQLWSRVFDKTSGELFEIQQQVGLAVSDMLNIKEDSNSIIADRHHPESEQSYKYFLMAQSYMKMATVESYEQALVLYEKAIELSPNYALAYNGKAVSYLLLYQYKHIDQTQAINNARLAIEKSLKIEPELAEAFATKALMYTYLKQYSDAEKLYLKALELQPNLRVAHHNYSFMLWLQSRFLEAIKHSEIAMETDPLSKATYFILADSLASTAEFEKSIATYQHCQKVLPKNISCFTGLANLYQIINRLDDAQAEFEKASAIISSENFWYDNTYASFLIHSKDFNSADILLSKTSAQNPTDYFLLRTRWLLALATDQMGAYINSIELLTNQFPDDMDVKKIRGLIAYQQHDYEKAISMYEKVMIDSPQFMLDLWDYSDGISHANNLAMSYLKTGRNIKKQKLLMQIDQHLNSFSQQFELMPGGIYIRSQYMFITGNNERAKQLISELQNNWSLRWLPKKDKAWAIK